MSVYSNKQKIIVILGQTAAGKSALAVKMARKIGGEVVSADSRQVYKGLDIGSGKITKKEMRGVPHHLLDVASPKRRFTAAQYQKLAMAAIKKILARGKTPIICGGTGLYIDSITKGIVFPEVPPNQAMRNLLEKKGADELFKLLRKIDPKRAKNIDAKNKVRLVRAIEIAKKLGRVPPLPSRAEGNPASKYEFMKIGLKLPENELKRKIKKRLLARMKEGMVSEVRKLHEDSLSWRRLEELGLEYRYVAQYLQKKISREEMLSKIKTESWRYAKRQMQWFKRDKEIKWKGGR